MDSSPLSYYPENGTSQGRSDELSRKIKEALSSLYIWYIVSDLWPCYIHTYAQGEKRQNTNQNIISGYGWVMTLGLILFSSLYFCYFLILCVCMFTMSVNEFYNWKSIFHFKEDGHFSPKQNGVIETRFTLLLETNKINWIKYMK